MTSLEAKEFADDNGIPLGQNFDRLHDYIVGRIIDAADKYGYTNAIGGRARHFYSFLNQMANI